MRTGCLAPQIKKAVLAADSAVGDAAVLAQHGHSVQDGAASGEGAVGFQQAVLRLVREQHRLALRAQPEGGVQLRIVAAGGVDHEVPPRGDHGALRKAPLERLRGVVRQRVAGERHRPVGIVVQLDPVIVDAVAPVVASVVGQKCNF